MKKLLLAFSCISILLSCEKATAQIQIQETFNNDLIIIGNISSGAGWNAASAIAGGAPTTKLAEHKLYCRLFKDKVTYGILVDTENRFDDDFEFALGTDVGTAIYSIDALLIMMNEKDLGTSATITDEDGRTIQLNLQKRNVISLKAIDAHGKVIVNDVYLTRKNLMRAMSLLDEKAEDKVAKAIAKNKNKQ